MATMQDAKVFIPDFYIVYKRKILESALTTFFEQRTLDMQRV